MINFEFILLLNPSPKMLSTLAQQLLGLLVFSNLASAVRFKFGVEEMKVGLTRDNLEDDGLLVIA
jgi:hypothetical protein